MDDTDAPTATIPTTPATGLLHRAQRPPKVHEQHDRSNPFARFNAVVAVKVTRGVGSMGCAYAFLGLSLLATPGLFPEQVSTVAVWLAQVVLQLVLLSIILVGTNVQAKAADARADATFRDAETLLAQHTQTRAELAAVHAALTELREHAGAPRRMGPSTPPPEHRLVELQERAVSPVDEAGE